MKNALLRTMPPLAMCLILSVATSAQTIRWDDGGFGKSWSNSQNWSPNSQPGVVNDVSIGDLASAQNDGTLIDQDYTIGNLDIMNFASADTNGNLLTAGIVDLGLGGELFVSEHSAGTRALRISGLTVNNFATFRMNGGDAAIGGTVTTNLGGTFGGFGEFRFLNGLGSPTTVFTNNGSFGTGRATGAAATEHFVLDMVANDADARIDLDGANDDRPVSLAENTTLNLGIRALNFRGPLSMSAGSVFNPSHVLQLNSGGTINVNAGGGSPEVPATATLKGAGVNVVAGSAVNVNSGTFVIDSDFFVVKPGASINVSATSGLQFNGTATIDGDLNTVGIFKLTVNGDLTINDDVFDWDGSGSTSSFTTVSSGGRLEINATSIAFDNTHSGTINVESGTLDVDVAAASWEMAGTLNLIGTDGNAIVAGTNLFVTGHIDADDGGSRINTAVQFEPGSSTHANAGADLFFTQPVTFSGGSTHTASGDGELSFGHNITVNAPTTINMPTGRVQLDSNTSNQVMNVNNDLTINALSLRSAVGSATGDIFTINIDNTDATLDVNLTGANEWTLGPDGRLNVTGSATTQTSLDGSPLNVKGFVAVNDTTRFKARIDLETGGAVMIAGSNVLFLEGGSQADPNRLEGGTYTGTGDLHSFSAGVRGHGQINNDVFFNGGSGLIAEGGTLILNGEVLAMDLIGAATGGTLHLGQSLDTDDVTALELSGGTVTASTIQNNGTTRGHGTIATSGFVNNGQLVASGGGQLIVNTNNAPDLDGTAGANLIHALSADLIIVDALSDSFGGTAAIEANRAIEFQQNWTLANGGRLIMDGNGATLRGANAQLDGQVDVAGRAVFEAPAIFRPTGEFNLPNANDELRLAAASSFIQPGSTFTGDGRLINQVGSTLSINVGSDVGVIVQNEGNLLIGGGTGVVDLEYLIQTSTGSMRFGLAGTAASAYDQFSVTFDAFLDGELDVDLQGGFNPSLNDAFLLIDSNIVTGFFTSLDLPGLASGLAWDVDYSDSLRVWLRVINDTISGDFDGNGDYACNDVDMLVSVIAAGSNDLSFDLTGDGSVNGADLDAWLTEAGAAELVSGNPYLLGDATLDGNVNGADFLAWNANKFSQGHGWCGGDFNADGSTDGSDFLIWNSNKFTSADSNVAAVPEPSSLSFVAFLALCFLRRLK